MSNRIIVVMILLAVLLGACAQDTQTVSPTETIAATDTAIPEPTEVSLASCVVQAAQPTLSPTLQAILPPLDLNDHTKGAEDAYVTVIEYGDFQ